MFLLNSFIIVSVYAALVDWNEPKLSPRVIVDLVSENVIRLYGVRSTISWETPYYLH